VDALLRVRLVINHHHKAFSIETTLLSMSHRSLSVRDSSFCVALYRSTARCCHLTDHEEPNSTMKSKSLSLVLSFCIALLSTSSLVLADSLRVNRNSNVYDSPSSSGTVLDQAVAGDIFRLNRDEKTNGYFEIKFGRALPISLATVPQSFQARPPATKPLRSYRGTFKPSGISILPEKLSTKKRSRKLLQTASPCFPFRK